MGKFLESIGLIEGYDIIIIGKKKAKNDILFEEIEKHDSNIKENIRKIVNESVGMVFAIVKDKKIKGVYLFEATSNNNVRILNHIKTVYTNEVSTDIRKKYDNLILKIAKDHVSAQDYDKVILEDKVVQVDRNTTKNRNLAMSSGFIFGFIFGWLLFHNFFWGLFYGFIFSPVSTGLEVIITNKRRRKKKNDK